MSSEIYAKNGFPRKSYIRKLLKRENIDVSMLTFNAEYGEKGAGILWKAHSIDDMMHEFCAECEAEFIDIARVKFFGQIHSIWFAKKNEYI